MGISKKTIKEVIITKLKNSNIAINSTFLLSTLFWFFGAFFCFFPYIHANASFIKSAIDTNNIQLVYDLFKSNEVNLCNCLLLTILVSEILFLQYKYQFKYNTTLSLAIVGAISFLIIYMFYKFFAKNQTFNFEYLKMNNCFTLVMITVFSISSIAISTLKIKKD